VVVERKTAIGVVAATYAILLVSWFLAAGGIDGIRRDPLIQLATLGIMAIVTLPVSWLTYRRMLRNPMVVPAGDPSPATIAQVGLSNGAVTLVASRRKVLLNVFYLVAWAGVVVTISLLQPGACRVVSVAATMALCCWAVGTWVSFLFVLPTLTFSRDALTLMTALRTQSWTWDEIREIKVTRPNSRLLGRLSDGIYFRRFQPPDRLAGPPRVGFRAMWNLTGEELGATLNAARARWSSSTANSYLPVPTTWRTYATVVIRLGVIVGIMWLWYSQPCARS
jgi:hypothetical protein